MAKIVIKKRIDLDFLGEDYKGGFVEFKSLSIKEVQDNIDEMQAIGDDNKKAVEMMLTMLGKAFIRGEFVNGDTKAEINKEDLAEFDMESISKFFSILSGQSGDLKV